MCIYYSFLSLTVCQQFCYFVSLCIILYMLLYNYLIVFVSIIINNMSGLGCLNLGTCYSRYNTCEKTEI